MCRQNENIKFKIRNALGLGKNECEIEDADNAYTVKPIAEKKALYIHSIRSVYGKGSNIHLFQLCNLTFEACIFTCEVNLQGEVDVNGKAIAINNTINFKNCTFHKPISFLCVMFDGDIVFRHSTFKDIVYFKEIIFNSETEFSWCNFKNKTNLENSIFSELDMSNSAFQHINIQQAKFKSGTDFSNCKFQDEADFSGSIFSQKANFTQAIFRASAYFDKAIFKGDTIFKRSEFCENAHFYQTEFGENLDFFQAMFNEYLNLTGTTIFNFNFEQIKFLIEQESEKIKKANEFRDIFKNIKNALIKSGNLLGASRFRKMELYCKEIELDLKKKEDRETSARDFVDKIQLYCYRVTSDHHTDLLLILNNVIFLIAWFGIMNGALNFLFNQDYFDLSIEKILITLGAFVACFIFAIITLCFMFGYFKIFFVAYARKRLYCKIRKLWKQFNLKCLYNKYKNKNGIFCIAYIITAIILVVKPALLVPIFGQMINAKSSIGFAFASLNIIYAIFMFLLVFSLQKTARKNTIVPN